MKKKILIVGGNGYVGSRLSNYLQEKSLNIVSVDSFLYGNTNIRSNKKTQTIIKKDIRDLKYSFLEKFDSVVCLAALSNNPIKQTNQKQSYDISRNFTIDLAKKIEKIGNQLIFPSSCSVYGKNFSKKKCSENSKINPLTFYSINKSEIETYLQKMSLKNRKFKCVVLRPATVFGGSSSIRFDIVINMLIGMSITYNKIILNSDGSAMRPFVYIDDLCNFFYKSIGFDENFLTVNAGFNNYNFSINNVSKIISKLTGAEIIKNVSSLHSELHKDSLIKKSKDERSYQVNFELAKKKLNISPKYSFEKSINRTYLDIKKILQFNNFESKNFYRLNKIKYMINNGFINLNSLKNTKN